jgi:apolipoprotein N-acyltransferase
MLGALSIVQLPFTLLTRWLASRSRTIALASAPAAWILAEGLRTYFPVGGFPWGALAYSQYPYRWITQLADLGGVFIVSYLVVLGNCAVASLLERRKWVCPAFFFGIFLAGNGYGIYRVHIWNPPKEVSLKVSLVQAGIELQGTRDYYAQTYFERLPGYYSQGVEEGSDLIVFAEAPNPFFFGQDFYFTTFWQKTVRQFGVPLIFNGSSQDEGSEKYYNSAYLLNSEGAPVFRYDKVHLVPFGEYLPYGQILGFAAPLVQEVGGFSPGEPPLELGRVGGVPFAILICYEAIFPSLTRSAVQAGAQVLVNITNDAWFGRTAAARQHLEIAAFRALETRKPVARCANTGFSAVIHADGRISQLSELFQRGVLSGEIHPNSLRTFYSNFGDWPIISFIMLSTALLAFWQSRKKRKGQNRGRLSSAV